MYIYFDPAFLECVQDRFSKVTADLHRVQRIRLFGTSGLYFKCKVLIWIHLIHICDNIFFQFLESFVLHTDNRTDSDQTEYFLQMFHSLIVIIISFTVYIDSCL